MRRQIEIPHAAEARLPRRIIQTRYSIQRTTPTTFNRPQRLRQATSNDFTMFRERPLPECNVYPLTTDTSNLTSTVADWESDDDEFTSDDEISPTLQKRSFLFSNLDGIDVRDEHESDHEAGNTPTKFDGDLQSADGLENGNLYHRVIEKNTDTNSSVEVTTNSVLKEEGDAMDEDVESAFGATNTTDNYFDCPRPNGIPVDDFHLAVMVLATACDLSHSQYEALRETLQLATLESIASLPETLTTLRERVRRNMPLLKLRGHDLKMDLTKVPPKSRNPKKAYCFEMQQYAERWLADRSIRQSMHFGLGIIGTSRQEFWHGDAWLGSVRTTAGEFAYIGNSPLLPSDCVSYFPTIQGVTSVKPTYLRIYGVGRLETSHGEPAVIAKRLISFPELNEIWNIDWTQVWTHLDTESEEAFPYFHADLAELVLLDSDRLVIPVSELARHESIQLSDTSPDDAARILSNPPSHCVRYIMYSHNGTPAIRRIHQRHRIPAEQELIDFGREEILKRFVIGEKRRISIPVTLFIDGFGLYRNAYKSLQGLYIQPACMDEPGRFTLQNMWVLMIGPFGTDASQIANCLEKEGKALGEGIELENGDTLIMFPLCITGDMPQQNQNAGVMSHLSRRGCRYCLIQTDDKGNLEYDVHRNGRYRQQHENLFTDIIRNHLSETAMSTAFSKHGISSNGHLFGAAFPSLDPFSAYPNDPMHAELRLAKYFHECLMKEVFSKAGTDAYEAGWNQINVPYGWGQPQNPVSHSGSIVFSENGRLAQMNPLVLLSMFNVQGNDPTGRIRHDARNKSYFKRAILENLKQQFGGLHGGLYDPVDTLLTIAWSMSRVIYLTNKAQLDPDEMQHISDIIKKHRENLCRFFTCTSKAKYTSIPNIHVALHYQQDILNYGTPRNVSVMIGEQKHKIHKAHASHTNSKDTELQLLKMVNLSQTMRFMLNGVHSSNQLSIQFERIVGACPVLQNKFLGTSQFQEPEPGNIESEGVFAQSRVGLPLLTRTIPFKTRLQDCEALLAAWNRVYNVRITNSMTNRFSYWGRMTCHYNYHNHVHKLSMPVGGFLRHISTKVFYRIVRIASISLGEMHRGFLLCRRLIRAEDQKIDNAPYDVFTFNTTQEDDMEVLAVSELEPMNVHFVQKSEDSWWWNPYTTHFL